MTQNLRLRPSTAPGTIRWARHPHGSPAETVLTGLGPTSAELTTLREEGAV